MRYAEKWSQVNIENLNLEKLLDWCTENLKGKQFIEGDVIKFSDEKEATKFKLEYKEK